MKKSNIKLLIISTALLVAILVNLSNVYADDSVIRNVCCEKTIYGAYCQNAPSDQCSVEIKPNTNSSYQQAPTSCEATSFCKQGCCYDSSEGLCMENTPKRVCENNAGSWTESKTCNIPQCKLGCCVLGNQAAFTGLVRCKKLSSFYGLETDFRTNIKTEDECIATAQAADQGACVYERDYDKTCKFTTRQGCKEITKSGGVTNTSIKFYKDYLCSNPDLATSCGSSERTGCVEGKDEVYFFDTCGNPANIYDSSKVNNTDYWKKIIPKALSCGTNKDNANSKACGNCDYFSGSMCKKTNKGLGDVKPTVGDYVCRNLDCKKTSLGIEKKHGESWCAYDAKTGNGSDVVGSQQIRHICLFGEEIIEACADFRQQQCIESSIPYAENGVAGKFSQAGCRVNRWQDCFTQTGEEDCVNTDKRDCYWIEDVKVPAGNKGEGVQTQASQITGNALFGGSDTPSSTPAVAETKLKKGACLPNIPPGLKFWESGESTSICGQSSQTVQVTYEKTGIIGGSYSCEKNCDVLTPAYAEAQNKICSSLGDCGMDINIAGKATKGGFEWKIDGEKKTTLTINEALLKSQLKIKTL